MTLKPIYLVDTLGEHARLPDGAIINAGGVSGPTFTVGGRGLLFDDGTSTGGVQPSLTVNFQDVYSNSEDTALIDFSAGKHLILHAVNDKLFTFNADTGDVTISGNLIVQGTTSTTIDDTVNTDRVIIHQSAGTYVPFLIEAQVGVTPTVDLVDIKVTAGGSSVFSISPVGSTYIQTLSTGLINGIDLEALQSQVSTHLAPIGIKHAAEQISVDSTELSPLSGSNVQEVLESVSASLLTGVRGVEYIQVSPADPWTIAHGQNTKRVQVTVWDEDDETVIPASIRLVDADTAVVSFGESVSGRAVLMLF